MTARVVADVEVLITCDEPGCDAAETVRGVHNAFHARMDAVRYAPWAFAHPPTYEADWCPKHRPKESRNA